MFIQIFYAFRKVHTSLFLSLSLFHLSCKFSRELFQSEILVEYFDRNRAEKHPNYIILVYFYLKCMFVASVTFSYAVLKCLQRNAHGATLFSSERVKTPSRVYYECQVCRNQLPSGLHNRNLCLNGEQTSQLLRHSCLASAIYITHDGNERNVAQLDICVFFSSTEIITWLKIFRLLCIIDNAIRLLISDKR